MPKYEELGIIDLKEHDARAFQVFLKEIEQPLDVVPVVFSGQL